MTSAEKKAKYGAKLDATMKRLELLKADANRVVKKTADCVKLIDVCKAKMAEPDDATK